MYLDIKIFYNKGGNFWRRKIIFHFLSRIRRIGRSFRPICTGNEADKTSEKLRCRSFQWPRMRPRTIFFFFCDKPGTPIKGTNVPTKWSWTNLPGFFLPFRLTFAGLLKIRPRFTIFMRDTVFLKISHEHLRIVFHLPIAWKFFFLIKRN